jgi:signal transduction histidine kinase
MREDRSVRRWLRFLAVAITAATAALAVAAVVVQAVAASRDVPLPSESWGGLMLLLAGLAPACVGVLVALRRPDAIVAWILILGAFSIALVLSADGAAGLALYDDPGSALGRWATVVGEEWPVLFMWPLALAYVFPDGRLPSPRWRPVAALAALSSIGVVVLIFLAPELEGPYGPVSTPLPFKFDEDIFLPLFWACWVGLLLSLFGGAAALRVRYRAGGPDERRQVLWLAYGALLVPLWLGGGWVLRGLIGPAFVVLDGIALVTFQVWPAVAVAVAVTRHGLYSIDRLFNRTVVYALLTALLAGTYAVVALLVGTLAGGSALSASVATLAGALVFRPLRDAVQTLVDRRFARARFDAVRLMREFLDDVRDGRAEPEDVGAMMRLALDDPGAEVVFRLPETGAYADYRGRLLDELPGDGREQSAIGRGDRELGVLLHTSHLARGPDVLRAVLDAAVVPVELARLRVELRLQLAEVESSRARIAQAGYAERRRIERDLHDGAQQRLVTLGIVLRRMQRSLPREARLLEPAFDAAVAEVAGAIADLRTIAAGVRPPRLDEGLAAALADLARGAAVPVEVAASSDRAPPEVEAAAYFVACEAVTNAVKHASPTHIVMRTSREDGLLNLLVADDGIGGAAQSSGSGLRGMADRVAAQGGTMTIDSPPGAGTRIAVRLPCGS